MRKLSNTSKILIAGGAAVAGYFVYRHFYPSTTVTIATKGLVGAGPGRSMGPIALPPSMAFNATMLADTPVLANLGPGIGPELVDVVHGSNFVHRGQRVFLDLSAVQAPPASSNLGPQLVPQPGLRYVMIQFIGGGQKRFGWVHASTVRLDGNMAPMMSMASVPVSHLQDQIAWGPKGGGAPLAPQMVQSGVAWGARGGVAPGGLRPAPPTPLTATPSRGTSTPARDPGGLYPPPPVPLTVTPPSPYRDRVAAAVQTASWSPPIS